MSTDPPQVVNAGIFAGYKNVVLMNSQFAEVLHCSIFSLDLVNTENS